MSDKSKFYMFKSSSFDRKEEVNRYTGGHVMPIASKISLQSSVKFENTMWEFQIACQNNVINNSAGGCRCVKGRWGMLKGG